MTKVFIDGRAGTTGLQIDSRMSLREDISVITLPESLKKDPNARKDAINSADFVFLCLPDAAAKEAAAMVENSHTRVIDASTAHRTNPAWAYGFPELSESHRKAIETAQFVANPGCHATGFISLVYPLVQMGILPPDYPLAAHSLTGYTGGGKKMIEQYEAPDRDGELDSPRHYGLTLSHKHIPEMMQVCGLTKKPIFCPIVCDFPQGMLVTVPLHFDLLPGSTSLESLQKSYTEFYAGQKNIHVMPLMGEGVLTGGCLGSNNVVGSNALNIFVCGNEGQAIVCAQFDNLGKGASGAAVQNLNIMMGIDENTGL
ncbi:MAG: N-acetyl-gamma-glutamyl-phosphate reductase [Oscillospiraceae bacterium]|nr:N-acetyl-gamma-glutamyl-phosphate reductase [Oscillospiraceae bacterium]